MATFCGNCGSPVEGDSKFCPNCGANAAASPQTEARVKKQKRPGKKIDFVSLITCILLLAASAVLVIGGIKIIPENIRQASLAYVPVEENKLDDKIREEYDEIKSGGTLFETAGEDEYEGVHVDHTWAYGEEDEDQ